MEMTCAERWVSVEYGSVPTRRSLLSRLRDVDDNLSWHSFFETYWRLIYNVARKSGLADQEAQDVVQDTVIAVARKLPQFRYDPEKGSFKNWLLLITRRRVQDHLRRKYRSLPEDSASAEAIRLRTENVPDPRPLPDARVDAAYEEAWRENLLETALLRVREQADPKHYQVFDFCVLQSVPAPEVARLLGMSRAQVYLAKHRLAVKLKRAVVSLEIELARRWSL
jgi:RNA polymerase sigma factor (sigma-70 family)